MGGQCAAVARIGSHGPAKAWFCAAGEALKIADEAADTRLLPERKPPYRAKGARSVRLRTDAQRRVGEDERMKKLLAKILLLALLSGGLLATTGWSSLAGAQSTSAAPAGSRAAAERAAVELRQGMTSGEVQQLLGKPWRTALTGNGGNAGTLRWTYAWKTSSSASESNLNVDFNAKAVEQWTVSGWSWSSY